MYLSEAPEMLHPSFSDKNETEKKVVLSLFFTWNWILIVQVNNPWSLSRISQFGYLRGYATKKEMKLEVSMTVYDL